jgi:predicted ATP-dependent endonuclease of OLD family
VKQFIFTVIFINENNLIKAESELRYSSSFENILPFAIKQVKVHSFQGIQELSVEHLNTDAQWVFLAGENSKGKSTILQAIAISLTGELETISNEDENFAIEYKDLNDNKILSLLRAFSLITANRPQPK